MKKILFLTSPESDYLQDSLLHGFKKLFGSSVIDFPHKPQLYSDYPNKDQLYGRGFTVYCNLPVDCKHHEQEPLKDLSQYDLVIVSSVHRQVDLLLQVKDKLDLSKTIFIDGEDVPFFFPMAFKLKKEFFKHLKAYWIIRKSPFYFKREFTHDTKKGIFYKLPFQINLVNHVRPIAFSIPEEKMVAHPPVKSKMFPTHIVDEEVASNIPEARTRYAFADEQAYYQDIQISKFGITTKRAGWDCMRHYEIAANRTVICFRQLDTKEESCAPHGLDSSNCIVYQNYEDLMDKVNALSDEDYQRLLNQTHQWVLKNTTRQRALDLIEIIQDHHG